MGDIYSPVTSGREWHHCSDNGRTTKRTKEPVCMFMCVNVCVCPPFTPNRIQHRLLCMYHWWKLLPFILAVTASGREGGKKNSLKDVGSADQCMCCHCICLSENLTVQVDSRYHFTAHLQAKHKKLRAGLKYPHAMHALPLAAVSCHVLYYQL